MATVWNRANSLVLAVLLAQAPWAFALDELSLEVRPGNTLIGIGGRYLEQPARWTELKRLNRVGNERRLRPGTLLRIPLDWLRWSELDAEVIHVHGSVTSNRGPLSAGMRIKAGDSFDTGAQGALTLRLSDGAIVVFAPMTRAALAVSRAAAAASIRATRIELQGGSAESTVAPLVAPASRFEIRTPRVVTAVRGTRFRVAADGEVSRHEVLDGVVALGSGTQDALRLNSGQGVRAQAGQLGAVVALLGAPDLSSLPALVERTAQRLEIAPMQGASGWRWQVAADAAFTQLLQDEKTPQPVWLLTGLEDGDFHLRVRAADAQELEGREAQAVLRVRARPEPPLQITPGPGASVVAGSALVWAELADAPAYHVQVSRDARFTDLLLDRSGVAASRIGLDPAWVPGLYYWRVATQRKDGSRGPFGDPASFTILQPSSLTPPELHDGRLRLVWSGPAGFSHQVQVAMQTDFSNPEFDQLVPGASVELPKPAPGTHHVRTRLVLPGGATGPWSAVQRFEVPPEKSWWPLLLIFLLPLL